MLTIQDLQLLRDGYNNYQDRTLHDALNQLGQPSTDDIIQSAVDGMVSDDRNQRVMMLRILAHQTGHEAVNGILKGLNDDKRRVLKVAIQSCPNYLAYPEVIQRLVDITTDPDHTNKIRESALSMLAGNEGRLSHDLSVAQVNALHDLMRTADYRNPILCGLVRLDLTPHVQSLLQNFVTSDILSEREMATRALDGERAVQIAWYEHNPTLQQHIMDTYDIAYGRVFYWIPRDVFADSDVRILQ